MKLFVTYFSHYSLNGMPFRCCKECSDMADFLDWLKLRALTDKKTVIVNWHYQTSIPFIAGGGNVPPQYRTFKAGDWWDPCDPSSTS